MKFREHKGGLEASMRTAVWLKDRADLIRHVQWLLRGYGIEIDPALLKVAPYGFDNRIGWNTHIVTLEGSYGVIGFTDGMPE